ncbi:Frag1/DRAM/Sfk1 [Ascosphaera apis ARSEF 7405]|uniref:Frag1/DRAM/Sfk1 n=1 Tax=Ascosphaera apis ARSEF 7405 TaxID=392613 RepID=A0A166N2E6_9EURO|nr:Frag1/DRAM/Sfk1 [Ascosphaera apis ARSEF 7405]
MWVISFWIIPIIAGCVWTAMLIAMLGRWSALGHPHIKSMNRDQHIAFISDVGAFSLKPLFISMSAVSASMFTSVFVIERWMRHARQLAPNTNRREKIFACISIFFALMGACGIIFLTIFDTWNHNNVHDSMLVLFIVGYILSAVFVCLEYYSLGLNYPEHRILKISFILKAIFIVVEFTLAVAFASESRNGNRDVAGVLEWTVSFIYGLYIFSYVPDLLPAVRFRKHVPQGERYKEEMRQAFAGDTNPNRSSYASQLPQSRGSDRSQYEMAENRNGQPASPTYPPEAHAQV